MPDQDTDSDPKTQGDGWYEIQDGWAIALANGLTANIQVTKKRGVCWNLMATGSTATIAEAVNLLEKLAASLMG